MDHFDIIIVGGGITGASAGARLAPSKRVLLLERESQPGYHSTGRSAALFSEIYGNAVIRALSRASRAFFTAPPSGFSERALLSPRGALHIARADQSGAVESFLSAPDIAAGTRAMSGDAAVTLSPRLKPGYVSQAFLEEDARDMDVHAIHTGFLRMLRAKGGVIATDANVRELTRKPGGGWLVSTADASYESEIIINAGGAWADEIAGCAGLAPLGLEPKRRTVIIVDPPQGAAIERAPLTVDIEEMFYFKPESGRLLVSPCDETPSPPCDAQPEDIDVAIAVERVEQATTLHVNRVQRKWAGLRTFAPDRSPVVGFDPRAAGFFWLAGLGGYGIQTSEAMGRLAAALALEQSVPDDLAVGGFDERDVSPSREMTSDAT